MPTSCGPIAAATSRTTGRASSSAIPILTLPGKRGPATGMADTVAYVESVEQLLIDALAELGVRPRRALAALSRGLARRRHCCTAQDRGDRRASVAWAHDARLRAQRQHRPLDVRPHRAVRHRGQGRDVARRRRRRRLDAGGGRRRERARGRTVGRDAWERQDVAWRDRPEDLSLFSRGHGAGEPVRLTGRLAQAGVTEGLQISTRKPEWLRAQVHHDRRVLTLRHTMRDLGLATVCEEAGCPNLFECWADGTATFMINGALVHPCVRLLPRRHRPSGRARRRRAVARRGGSRSGWVSPTRSSLPSRVTISPTAVRAASSRRSMRSAARAPDVAVEVLIPDCKGDVAALEAIFAARPDVLNHNIETVPRLQRAVRPSARLRPQPRGARPRQGRGARHEVRPDRRDGRDRRRGRGDARGSPRGRQSTS